jgi:hypothetical protein
LFSHLFACEASEDRDPRLRDLSVRQAKVATGNLNEDAFQYFSQFTERNAIPNQNPDERLHNLSVGR